MEIGLVLIAAMVAMCLIATGDFGWAMAVLVAYIPLSITLQNWLRQWRDARIFEIYRYQFEPIFEIQQGANDAYNFERAEYHRKMLIESGNEIYARCLITVEEIYDRDPRFGYAETPDEQAIRRADYIREFLNNWALKLTKQNAVFVKQWLNRQSMNDIYADYPCKEDPSVLLVERTGSFTGSFIAYQFPLLNRLIRFVRGKEVVEV